MRTLSEALVEATAVLIDAAVPSPGNDARLIAGHLLDVDKLQLFLRGDGPVPAGFDEMVARRATREPLQYILGVAPFGPLDLKVGPGVFIPRPETEVLADWSVKSLNGISAPRVVDLCTGSGALAAYLAHERTDAEIAAVEKSPEAAAFARLNLPAQVQLILGDATSPELLAEWNDSCDLVVSNPPYVPETPDLDPEVYQDPHEAVFAGADGMSVINEMVDQIHRLLRRGGVTGIEHDDATSELVQQVLRSHGGFAEVAPLSDLTGRARFVTASKV
ncbi:peptide chain release factor N(5)-glutamine methyltransferase [Corynebacterium sp. A21]|uniref:peptide chain release factor N(5)-glutamine methyltransferase n=1 Tax=Corynebacterium sp. A21 TaxID=3457318 RepID=UPI003FD0EF99